MFTKVKDGKWSIFALELKYICIWTFFALGFCKKNASITMKRSQNVLSMIGSNLILHIFSTQFCILSILIFPRIVSKFYRFIYFIYWSIFSKLLSHLEKVILYRVQKHQLYIRPRMGEGPEYLNLHIPSKLFIKIKIQF